MTHINTVSIAKQSHLQELHLPFQINEAAGQCRAGEPAGLRAVLAIGRTAANPSESFWRLSLCLLRALAAQLRSQASALPAGPYIGSTEGWRLTVVDGLQTPWPKKATVLPSFTVVS